MMRVLLFPFSLLFICVVWFKNTLYDRRWLRAHKASLPVISIGNLTFGGTGKTPVVLWLADYFSRRQQPAAIISRGYKSRSSEPRRVNAQMPITEASRLFGDEPTLMAAHRP